MEADRTSSWLMVVSSRRRARPASASRSFFFLEEPRARPTRVAERFAGRPPAAVEQVLRRRDLRRGHRPADPHRVGGRAVEGRRRAR